jgi:hypothetical protein
VDQEEDDEGDADYDRDRLQQAAGEEAGMRHRVSADLSWTPG